MAPATRPKNKSQHPAAPVMTAAAKRKAGIKTAQRPKPKKVTKDQTIWELRAQLAAFENPDEETFSKEPLVPFSNPPLTCYALTQAQFTKGSSPMPDEDEEEPFVMETEVQTEIDSDEYVSGRQKRTAKSSLPDTR